MARAARMLPEVPTEEEFARQLEAPSGAAQPPIGHWGVKAIPSFNSTQPPPPPLQTNTRVTPAESMVEARNRAQADESWQRDYRQYLPFIRSAAEIYRNVEAIQAVDRIQRGYAYESDYDAVARLVLRNEHDRDKTPLEKIKDTLSAMPAFMAEFYLTGGAFTAGEAAATRLITEKLGEEAAKRFAAKAAGKLAGVAVQSAANPTMVGEAVSARQVPGVFRQVDPQTNQETFWVQPVTESTPVSVIRGYADTMIELGTERTGSWLTKNIPGVRQLADAVARRAPAFSSVPIRELTKKVAEEVGYDGPISEMMEERLGDVLRSLIGNQPLADAIPSFQQLGVELAAFSVPEAAGHAVNRIAGGSYGFTPEQERALRERVNSQVSKETMDAINANIRAEEARRSRGQPPPPQGGQGAGANVPAATSAGAPTANEGAGGQPAPQAILTREWVAKFVQENPTYGPESFPDDLSQSNFDNLTGLGRRFLNQEQRRQFADMVRTAMEERDAASTEVQAPPQTGAAQAAAEAPAEQADQPVPGAAPTIDQMTEDQLAAAIEEKIRAEQKAAEPPEVEESGIPVSAPETSGNQGPISAEPPKAEQSGSPADSALLPEATNADIEHLTGQAPGALDAIARDREERLRVVSAAYTYSLIQAWKKNPGRYMDKTEEGIKATGERMMAKVRERGSVEGVNIDTPSWRAAARQLGIKNTQIAWNNYINARSTSINQEQGQQPAGGLSVEAQNPTGEVPSGKEEEAQGRLLSQPAQPAAAGEPSPAASRLERVRQRIQSAQLSSDEGYQKAKADLENYFKGGENQGTTPSGVDPKLVTLTAKLLASMAKKGVVDFGDAVWTIAEQFPQQVEAMLGAIESGWRALRQLGHKVDEPGDAAALLKEYRDATTAESTSSAPADQAGSEAGGPPAVQPGGDVQRPGGEGPPALEPPPAQAGGPPAEAGSPGAGAASSGEPGGGDVRRPSTEGVQPTGEQPAGGAGVHPARPGELRGERSNYRITADSLAETGAVTKFNNNIAAITLLKRIEDEGRQATEEEKAVLVQYAGWGQMPQAFEDPTGKWTARIAQLRNLLTPEELKAARASTPNAHYTSVNVIRGMWDGIKALGLSGGQILEPGAGIGHFFGLIPKGFDAKRMTAIEMDSISSRILKLLYPDAAVFNRGYQETTIPANSVDLTIGNVPFAEGSITDKADRALTRARLSLHNYYFAKAIKGTRPGGLIAMITSRFSMDSLDSGARTLWRELGADLVGAIRLPRQAFKANAGTEVVTDLIILQKRPQGVAPGGQAFTVRESVERDGAKFDINEYWKAHPEDVLGTMSYQGSMYGGNELTVDGVADLRQPITEAMARMASRVNRGWLDWTSNETNRLETAPVVEANGRREGNIYELDGQLYKSQGGRGIPIVVRGKGVKKGTATYQRIQAWMGVRDAAIALREAQLSPSMSEADVEAARKRLNDSYDLAVKKWGVFSRAENWRVMAMDDDLPFLLSLENYDEEKDVATKTPMFTERTQWPQSQDARAETPEAALSQSLGFRGAVDLEYMERVSGIPAGELRERLGDQIYDNPGSGRPEPASTYLSGEVKAKLAEARAAAETDPRYQRNVDALLKVQPADKGPADIKIRPGARWVGPETYERFIAEVFGSSAKVEYVRSEGTWLINVGRLGEAESSDYGSDDALASWILERGMNLRPIVVKVPGPEGEPVTDPNATALAKANWEKIQERFNEWMWEDAARTETMVRRYNDQFNTSIQPVFDGQHMRLPGMVDVFRKMMRDYQLSAIYRQLTSPVNTLFAHTVGAGKTWEIVASAMERRRLGISRKQVIVVPNHLISQWPADFLKLYPSARVLAVEPEDMVKGKRGTVLNRIATGDWDAVIVPQTTFEKMSMSPARQEEFFNRELDQLEQEIREAKAQKGDTKNLVKELEKARDALQALLEKLSADWKKDAGPYFDDLGIDHIYVDEAHDYKNLWFRTKINRMPGVAAQMTQKTFDMYMKTRHLNEITGNRGVTFATGTPISNSITEMYTLQRYLQPQVLADRGLDSFDAWVQMFGLPVTEMEVTPEGGGFRPHTRMNRFANVQELMQMVRQSADTVFDDTVKLPKPPLRNGRIDGRSVDASPMLKSFVESLVKRAEAVRRGQVDPRDDNMLAITTDGRKAALDMRLVDPRSPDMPDSKLNVAVRNVIDIYHRTNEDKLTQIIWCDLGSPNASGVDAGRINLYADMKRKFVEAGIPAGEVAFIHDAETGDERLTLFRKVNSGEVRILIGSSAKLGTGANIQERLTAAHHLDAPWRPADVEQRDGRILRPGNRSTDFASSGGAVDVFRYVTKGSFDAYMWQTLEQKAKFIYQVWSTTLNEVDDVDSGALTYAEIKALASENPLMMEYVKVKAQVGQLQAEKSGFDRNQLRIRREVDTELPAAIAAARSELGRLAEDAKRFEEGRAATKEGETGIVIDGAVFTKRADAGRALIKKAAEQAGTGAMRLGTVYGVPLDYVVRPDPVLADVVSRTGQLRGSESYPIELRILKELPAEPTDDQAAGIAARVLNAADVPANRMAWMGRQTNEKQARLDQLREKVARRWEKADALDAARRQLADLEQKVGISEGGPTGGSSMVKVGDAMFYRGTENLAFRQTKKGSGEWVVAYIPPEGSRLKARVYSQFTMRVPSEVGKDFMLEYLAAMQAVGSWKDSAPLGWEDVRDKFHAKADLLRERYSAEGRARAADAGPEEPGPQYSGVPLPTPYRPKVANALAEPPKVVGARALPAKARATIEASRGLGRRSMFSRIAQAPMLLYRALTRGQMDLPRSTKWINAYEILNRIATLKSYAQQQAARYIATVLRPIGPNLKVYFNDRLLADNLLASLSRGEPLRQGLVPETPAEFEEWMTFLPRDEQDMIRSMPRQSERYDAVATAVLQQWSEEIDKEVAALPAESRNALATARETRQAIVREVVKQLIGYKLLNPAMIDRTDAYMHQQVLLYARLEQGLGPSSKPGMTAAPFQRSRVTGPAALPMYNTEYTEAELRWLSHGIAQIEKQKLLNTLDQIYGKKGEFKRTARRENYERLVGKGNIPLINQLKAQYAQAAEDGESGEVLAGLADEINKLDPTWQFTRKIGRFSAIIRRLHPDAPGGEEFDPSTLEPWEDEDHEWWQFLRYLMDVDKDGPGGMSAGAVFSAMDGMKKLYQQALGRDLLTWRDVMHRTPGYAIWQPRPGNYFYRTLSVVESVAEAIQAGLLDKIKLTEDQFRTVLAMGGRRTEFVLPVELVKTLDNFTTNPPSGPAARLVQMAMSGIKNTWLFAPWNAAKYIVRNLLGDVDAAFGGMAFGAGKYIPQAASELWKATTGRVGESPEFQAAKQWRVVGSGFVVQEWADIRQHPAMKRFFEGDVTKGEEWKRAILAGLTFPREVARFREDLLRYAVFLWYRRQIADNKVTHAGGSFVEWVKEIRQHLGNDAAAAHLARNLLGDYSDKTVLGRWVARNLFPFEGWIETLFTRYPRFFYNAFEYGRLKGKDSAWARAVYTGAALASIGAMYAAMQVYNWFVQDPRKEQALSTVDRSSPHVNICWNGDGYVRTLRNVTASGDFTDWLGINRLIQLFPYYRDGNITGEQLAQQIMMRPAEKFVDALGPQYKAPLEVGAGLNLFPEPFSPRRQARDEALANNLGVRDIYMALRGYLLKDGTRAGKNFTERMFVNLVDPKRNALSEIYGLRGMFLARKGKGDDDIGQLSQYRTIRQAAYDNDPGAFAEAKAVYLAQGGDLAKFFAFTESLDPIETHLNPLYEQEFVRGLTPPQREKLDVARRYAADLQVMLMHWWMQTDTPEQRRADLQWIGKKRIADARTRASGIAPRHAGETDEDWQKRLAAWKDARENATRRFESGVLNIGQ